MEIGDEIWYEGDTWEIVWKDANCIQIRNIFGGSQFIDIGESAEEICQSEY